MGNASLRYGSGPCHLCRHFQGWETHLDRQIVRCKLAYLFYGNAGTGCKDFDQREDEPDSQRREP